MAQGDPFIEEGGIHLRKGRTFGLDTLSLQALQVTKIAGARNAQPITSHPGFKHPALIPSWLP
jgi:hypothetical protein